MEEQCEEKHCKLLYEYVIIYGALVFSPFPLRTAIGQNTIMMIILRKIHVTMKSFFPLFSTIERT